MFKSFDVILDFVKTSREIETIKKNHEIYKEIIPVFVQSYDALVGVYGALAKH